MKPDASWGAANTAFAEARVAHPSAKTVYLVRHGEGDHNAAEREYGSEHWENVVAKSDKYFDAHLNVVGLEQCSALSTAVASAEVDGMRVDVIIVSPLTRAIETAKYGMASAWGTVPVYAVELSRERFGKNMCDKRKSVAQLKQEFPEVNFDLFMESEEDAWFTEQRETDEQVERRVALFYEWLMHTPWTHVAVVGHSSYMAHSIKTLGAPYYWPANCELVPLVVARKPDTDVATLLG